MSKDQYKKKKLLNKEVLVSGYIEDILHENK